MFQRNFFTICVYVNTEQTLKRDLRSELNYQYNVKSLMIVEAQDQLLLAVFAKMIHETSFQHIPGFVTRVTRRVPLEEQELLIFPRHPTSVLSWVRVA